MYKFGLFGEQNESSDIWISAYRIHFYLLSSQAFDKFNFDTILDHFKIWKIRGMLFLKRQIDTKYELKYLYIT